MKTKPIFIALAAILSIALAILGFIKVAIIGFAIFSIIGFTMSVIFKKPDYEGSEFTVTSVGNTSVSIQNVGEPYNISLKYKKGSEDWVKYTIGSAISLSDGESLMFRAGLRFRVRKRRNPQFSVYRNHLYFVITGEGNVKVSGNIMSLLYRTMENSFMPGYTFYSLFKNCDKLVDASMLKLPATNLAHACYCDMFSGCTSLVAAPELPATTLSNSCYSGMFSGCSSLVTAPELPATNLAGACYASMFSGCTSLVAAPELPATTLSNGCYSGMFSGCTSLVAAPELPATNLAGCCYSGMFSGCSSLVTAPELPATTLVYYCYHGMFSGCTSLTTAPELPAISFGWDCYENMFSGCSKLNYVKALFATTPPTPSDRVYDYPYDYDYSFWLSDVSSKGTFVKSKNATWERRDYAVIPYGWTVVDE